MANYSNLAATINAQIKANGNQEITGPVLNAVLTAMVTVLGDGYRLKGVAAPADNPGSPDNRVAYLASQDGTYTNFGGLALSGEIALLLWDASWSKVSVVQIDAAPTEGSANLVTSGGVDAALKSIVAGLAEQDGHYPDLFAGFAGNLVDTRSAGTRQSFAFRQSGGDGVNYMRKILGRTEAWNQLVGPSDTQVTIPSGHLYYAIINGTASVGTSDGTPISVTGGTDIVVDLTLEGLGLTTADQFRALHPLPYYNYNAGVLKNNAATGIKTRGLNQWDEQWELGLLDTSGNEVANNTHIRTKNPIPVLPSRVYYFRISSSYNLLVCEYDASGNFISGTAAYVSNGTKTTASNAAYIKFCVNSDGYGTTYNHDICINRSDPDRNGEYEPYWKREIVMGLDNLACHDENNNAVVVNGLDGVGTAQDELIVENGWGKKINKKMEEVDLGDSEWSYYNEVGHEFMYINLSDAKPAASGNTKANILCSALPTITSSNAYQHTLEGIGLNETSQLRVYTSTMGTDPAAFKAAMAGVKLRFELATPKVLTLDNPIPALIEVDNLGTEKRLPEDTADNPQAPFECDSNYSVSTANLVRLLNL